MANERIGPLVTVKHTCSGCKFERSERYRVQGDSGHDIYCDHPSEPGRSVGDTNWTTPDWCPVAAPQAETDWDDGKSYSPAQAKDRVRLWFFRDLSSEQRLMLFSLFQMPVDEIGEFHGIQKLALNRVIGQCTPPQPEGGAVEKMARALWLAEGFREELWDSEHRDSWGPYMHQQRAKYREKAEKIFATLREYSA